MLIENADSFSGGVSALTDKLFAGKTPQQAVEITACFLCARHDPVQTVLEQESFAFYRLMEQKNGGKRHA